MIHPSYFAIKKSLRSGGKLTIIEPVGEERKGWSREKLGDKHEIAMHFAIKDLERVGFQIVRREKKFIDRTDQKGDHLWLLVAEVSK